MYPIKDRKVNLGDFIERLRHIADSVDDAHIVPVRMADTLPVVEPVYKDGVVYITDQAEKDVYS